MNRIEMPIPLFAKLEYYDHMEGELAVDGYEYGILYLNDKQTQELVEKIKQDPRWRNDQLNEWIKNDIKGMVDKEDSTGIINVKNGYWFFRNTSSKETNIFDFDNYIENLNDKLPCFAVAVLDVDNNKLYFYEMKP